VADEPETLATPNIYTINCLRANKIWKDCAKSWCGTTSKSPCRRLMIGKRNGGKIHNAACNQSCCPWISGRRWLPLRDRPSPQLPLLSTIHQSIKLLKSWTQSLFKVLEFFAPKKADIEAQSRSAAEALVATRNQVAHAKSDYRPTGVELPLAELSDFNAFLEAAAVQTIRWYNRLPVHLKLKF
jgi:hypothetical protein